MAAISFIYAWQKLCPVLVFRSVTATSQFINVHIGQKMQLTGRDHGTRNATCADTQTSTEWPYCPFAMLCRRPFDKAETYTRQGIVAQRVIM